MTESKTLQYSKIADAINYIKTNFQTQPSLDDIAASVHLSPFHFQRLFTEWAGVSPKKFLQYISIQHAKSLLQKPTATLFDTAAETGFSSSSRLHDLFVNIEGMTPGEYKNGGEHLQIKYSFANTMFGDIIIAATEKGVCYIAFIEDNAVGFTDLQSHFPKANFIEQKNELQEQALHIFSRNWTDLQEIKLHLKGTDFQIKVWEALLKIPMGQLITYGDIANTINSPKASRAVGTAIGSNPVAFLIPCHRVIQATGNIGGYMWGTTRKTAIIGWEAATIFQ
ncbi:methylated-DNA--[protein]-cysteine S-methyltransferase [Parasediminibacterium paludis]|uniref:Methylated-DNA--[protein]-cysteine S-methyltransferase n=1 Tax=Parasediminibacterium paludis TaxID=908966 RepID=A0ABV8PXZ9_9BACT